MCISVVTTFLLLDLNYFQLRPSKILFSRHIGLIRVCLVNLFYLFQKFWLLNSLREGFYKFWIALVFSKWRLPSGKTCQSSMWWLETVFVQVICILDNWGEIGKIGKAAKEFQKTLKCLTKEPFMDLEEKHATTFISFSFLELHLIRNFLKKDMTK